MRRRQCGLYGRFLSTLSLRRATAEPFPVRYACAISIHALLAESDKRRFRMLACFGNFYPRSPCGERLFSAAIVTQHPRDFYPRSPCGERLLYTGDHRIVGAISIHALLAESDCSGETKSGGM